MGRSAFSGALGRVGALAALGALSGLMVTGQAQGVIDGSEARALGANAAVNPGCSGTVIGRRWVAAAAHCLKGVPTGQVFVRAGSLNWKVTPQTAACFVATEDDLALVMVKKVLPVEPARLGSADPKPGDVVTFFGWGWHSAQEPSPDALRVGTAVTVTPWNGGRGDAFGGPSWTVRFDGRGKVAGGDSGGGAYLDDELVGVTSNADDLGANFVSIAAHLDFIERTTGVTAGSTEHELEACPRP